ncbi:nutrient deprivation-induced protein [Rhizobium helianthi]|uniref:Nutrient deprivation-induced protein n=1 Tax=Rhizobium helianthi TaxID=1132695 RepID=A0ABW4M007_9HYPH
MADRDPTSAGGDRLSPTYGSMRPEAPRASATSSPPQNQPQPKTQTDLRQQVQEDAHVLGDMAREQMHQASAKAQDMAEEQKGYAAQRVAGIADAIERVGSELEQGENRDIGRMTRQMGQSVQRFAQDIKGKSMSEVAGMAEDFGRRQPLAFLGLAAMAGLAASRFVSASASRQAGSSHSGAPSTRVPSSHASASASASTPSESRSAAPAATLNTTGASNV